MWTAKRLRLPPTFRLPHYLKLNRYTSPFNPINLPFPLSHIVTASGSYLNWKILTGTAMSNPSLAAYSELSATAQAACLLAALKPHRAWEVEGPGQTLLRAEKAGSIGRAMGWMRWIALHLSLVRGSGWTRGAEASGKRGKRNDSSLK